MSSTIKIIYRQLNQGITETTTLIIRLSDVLGWVFFLNSRKKCKSLLGAACGPPWDLMDPPPCNYKPKYNSPEHICPLKNMLPSDAFYYWRSVKEMPPLLWNKSSQYVSMPLLDPCKNRQIWLSSCKWSLRIKWAFVLGLTHTWPCSSSELEENKPSFGPRPLGLVWLKELHSTEASGAVLFLARERRLKRKRREMWQGLVQVPGGGNARNKCQLWLTSHKWVQTVMKVSICPSPLPWLSPGLTCTHFTLGSEDAVSSLCCTGRLMEWVHWVTFSNHSSFLIWSLVPDTENTFIYFLLISSI